jgi:hypothetical protein
MIKTCLETALHKDDYMGAGAADNSHQFNDDFRAGLLQYFTPDEIWP